MVFHLGKKTARRWAELIRRNRAALALFLLPLGLLLALQGRLPASHVAIARLSTAPHDRWGAIRATRPKLPRIPDSELARRLSLRVVWERKVPLSLEEIEESLVAYRVPLDRHTLVLEARRPSANEAVLLARVAGIALSGWRQRQQAPFGSDHPEWRPVLARTLRVLDSPRTATRQSPLSPRLLAVALAVGGALAAGWLGFVRNRRSVRPNPGTAPRRGVVADGARSLESLGIVALVWRGKGSEVSEAAAVIEWLRRKATTASRVLLIDLHGTRPLRPALLGTSADGGFGVAGLLDGVPQADRVLRSLREGTETAFNLELTREDLEQEIRPLPFPGTWHLPAGRAAAPRKGSTRPSSETHRVPWSGRLLAQDAPLRRLFELLRREGWLVGVRCPPWAPSGWPAMTEIDGVEELKPERSPRYTFTVARLALGARIQAWRTAIFRVIRSARGAGLSPRPDRVRVIPLNRIHPSPVPPCALDDEALRLLAASIQAYGVIIPVLVRPFRNGYQLLAGEQRVLAARRLGMKGIPAIVRPMGDLDAEEIRFAENLHRGTLSGSERAAVAERLARKLEGPVGGALPILVQKAADLRMVSGALAEALASVPDPRAQLSLIEEIYRNKRFDREGVLLIEQHLRRDLAGDSRAAPEAERPVAPPDRIGRLLARLAMKGIGSDPGGAPIGELEQAMEALMADEDLLRRVGRPGFERLAETLARAYIRSGRVDPAAVELYEFVLLEQGLSARLTPEEREKVESVLSGSRSEEDEPRGEVRIGELGEKVLLHA